MGQARDRSLALLEREAFSLLDAFVIVFADNLIDTLQRDGPSYASQEENLRVGTALVHEQLRRNAVQRQRLFVAMTPSYRTPSIGS
jgi:5-methylcytosine-specific restriction endonuclease McrBC regulatory subunit McrC